MSRFSQLGIGLVEELGFDLRWGVKLIYDTQLRYI